MSRYSNIYFRKSASPTWDLFALPYCGWGLTILSYHYFLLFFIYPFNDSAGILHCGISINLINNIFLPTQWISFSRLFIRLIYSFGGLCATSISSVATNYDSLSLRGLVGLPILLLVVVNLITSKTLCLLDLFQPKTSTFSTRALFWVYFKTVR